MRAVYYLSPRQVDIWEDNARTETWTTTKKVGPLRAVASYVFGWGCIYYPYERLIDKCLGDAKGTREPKPLEKATEAYRTAVEWAWIWVTLFLIGIYALAFFLVWSKENSPDAMCEEVRRIGLVILAMVSIHRLLDITSLAMRLFIFEDFKTTNLAFSLFLSTLAYVQIIVCFGVLYLADYYVCHSLPLKTQDFTIKSPNADVEVVQRASKNKLKSDIAEAFYLSSLIITTLGTGDYEFNHIQTQGFVLSEVLLGLLFIIVVFQRILGGHQTPDATSLELPIDIEKELKKRLDADQQYVAVHPDDSDAVLRELDQQNVSTRHPMRIPHDNPQVVLIQLDDVPGPLEVLHAIRKTAMNNPKAMTAGA